MWKRKEREVTVSHVTNRISMPPSTSSDTGTDWGRTQTLDVRQVRGSDRPLDDLESLSCGGTINRRLQCHSRTVAGRSSWCQGLTQLTKSVTRPVSTLCSPETVLDHLSHATVVPTPDLWVSKTPSDVGPVGRVSTLRVLSGVKETITPRVSTSLKKKKKRDH